MIRQRGSTLIELLLASVAMLFVAWGFVALTVAASRSYTRTTTRSDLALPVSQAVAHIARDLQEAKSVTVNSAYQITIYLPSTNTDGTYNRSVLNTTGYIEWFRANGSNQPSSSGTFLVRRIGGANPMRVARNITGVTFASDSSSIIETTLTATGSNGMTFSVSQRSSYMRNY